MLFKQRNGTMTRRRQRKHRLLPTLGALLAVCAAAASVAAAQPQPPSPYDCQCNEPFVAEMTAVLQDAVAGVTRTIESIDTAPLLAVIERMQAQARADAWQAAAADTAVPQSAPATDPYQTYIAQADAAFDEPAAASASTPAVAVDAPADAPETFAIGNTLADGYSAEELDRAIRESVAFSAAKLDQLVLTPGGRLIDYFRPSDEPLPPAPSFDVPLEQPPTIAKSRPSAELPDDRPATPLLTPSVQITPTPTPTISQPPESAPQPAPAPAPELIAAPIVPATLPDLTTPQPAAEPTITPAGPTVNMTQLQSQVLGLKAQLDELRGQMTDLRRELNLLREQANSE
jgi:hypothetical protein